MAQLKRLSQSLKVALFGLLVSSFIVNVEAHHSRANFDIDSIIELSGTVTIVRWRSPHVFWAIDVTNEQGEIESWTIEGHSISGLMGNGWQEDSVKVGDHVDVLVNPNRNPDRKFGLLDYFEHDDGRIFYSFRPPEGVEPLRRNDDQMIVPSSDFSGTWTRMSGENAAQSLRAALVGGFSAPTELALTPIAEEQVANFDMNNDPYLDCVPLAVPRIITWPYAHRWTRSPNQILIEKEQSPQVRVIHFDQDVPPEGYVSTELGFSAGRILDDGSLIITSNNFAPTPWGIVRGLDSSSEKQVIEEYKLADDGLTVSYSFTVSDSVYLTEPLITEGRYRKIADHEFTNVPCDIETSRQHLQFE
jgi:hypothetical protein